MTDQYASLGVTFTGVYYNPDTKNYNANIDGDRIGNFIPFVPATNSFSIRFTVPQKQVAFALSAPTGSTEIDAYLNGTLVSAQTVATSLTSADNFFGFQDVQLDEIRITSINAFDHTELIDNIQYGAPVPEASSVVSLGVLLTLGLGGAAFSVRRRKVDRI